MSLSFSKLQAAGNGYLAIDGHGRNLDGGALAKAMGRAHFGVGADGLVVAGPSRVAPIRMRVFNTDGGEAEISGNGLRLFTKFVLDRGLVGLEEGALQVETGAGVRTVWPRFEAGRVVSARIAMGVPKPTGDGAQAVFEIGGRPLRFTTLEVGNPHAVHLIDTPVAAFPLERVAPQVQAHSRFPNGVNVEVARVLGATEVEARIFERGEGETLSSGTGSTAVAVAARWAGLTDAAVRVGVPGGELGVVYEGAGAEAMLDGPTVEVFTGVWPLG